MSPTMIRATGSARLAMTLLATVALACRGPEAPRPAEEAGAPLSVTAITAALAPVAERLEAGGVVAAGQSATLASRIVAPVMSVRARAGDRVRAGDLLVVLDDQDMAARARGAEASVSAAQHGLAVATTEHASAVADQKLAAAWHARIASLHAQRSATTQELDEADARLSSATARLAGAGARVEEATSRVTVASAEAETATIAQSFGAIRAPFDGLVTERLIDPGNLAAPGTPLLRIDSVGVPHVEVRVDEAREGYVRVGDRVELLFEDGAAAAALAAEGVVTEIARAVAADTRAFTVKVSLPRDRAPRAGTFARVRFRGAARQTLLVPASAIRRQGQLATLFVIDSGVARLRIVQSGYEGAEGVEILAGLDPGEVVVGMPPPGLTEGRRVLAQGTRVGAGR